MGYYPPYSTINKSLKAPDGLKEILDAALAEPDPAKAMALNQKLSKAVYDDAMVICFLSDARGYVVSPKVQGGHWLEGADWQYWSPADTWIKK
jgi:hypothetical protein